MYMRFHLSLVCIFLITSCVIKQENAVMDLIENGEFREATALIEETLSRADVPAEERKKLSYELERMKRIRLDFNKSEQQILGEIKETIPGVTPEDLRGWEESKALECMVIDGEKRYFARAVRNLFRIDKACKLRWEELYGAPDPEEPRKVYLNNHIRNVINHSLTTGESMNKAARFKVRYTLTVNADAVPDGEILRCWLPFPREIPPRQVDIRLLSSNPDTCQLADNRNLQRTIYMERRAQKNVPTVFSAEYEFTNHGIYVDIDPDKVISADPGGPLAEYLKEVPPHVVFSKPLKELSASIVGDERNPYRKAQKIYQWIDENIPWASAREYSTIRNISLYPVIRRYGDCGIKSLLFITLLRMNGIPARWQSGWEFQPPSHDNMHDWGMAYFEPYGWVPIDVDYGLRNSDDEKFKWFYLSGMDAFRLIFNDDISQPFEPPKYHLRSETVDSQRGEVEWQGGNLYFDQWSWDMKWERILDESI